MKVISRKRQEKGITLITLVATIIVLLILASVSITALRGEKGLLKKATNASDNTNESFDKEKLQKAAMEAYNTRYNAIDYSILEEELSDWTIESSTGKAISPNGNIFDCNELLGIENSIPIPDTNKKVYLDPKVWTYVTDESTHTAMLLKYSGNDSVLIIPNYIKGENGDIPIKIVGGGTENWGNNKNPCIWADSISTTSGGYYGYPR